MAFREPPCHLITTADSSPFTKFCLFPLLLHTLSLNFTSSFSLPLRYFLLPLSSHAGHWLITVNKSFCPFAKNTYLAV